MTSGLPVVGDTLTTTHTFTPDSISAFARSVGDMNPLHHDRKLAEASRFGGLIASGTHTASIMMGAVASWTSGKRDAVGLGYSVRLRRHVPEGAVCTITWTIVSLERNERLGGYVLKSEGRLVREDGEVAVTGVSEALIFDGGAGKKL